MVVVRAALLQRAAHGIRVHEDAAAFAILVIIVAAAEIAVGLALIVAIYKQRKSVIEDRKSVV